MLYLLFINPSVCIFSPITFVLWYVAEAIFVTYIIKTEYLLVLKTQRGVVQREAKFKNEP